MRILLCLLIVGICHGADPAPSIQTIVEVRQGRTSVWGLQVDLPGLPLKDLAQLRKVQITETKHDHDITNLFQISTTADLSTICIRFKDGCGDFGTANRAVVRIPGDAFATARQEPLAMVIATDTPDRTPPAPQVHDPIPKPPKLAN